MDDLRLDTDNRWLLPDGIDEFLPPQAERLEKLRRELLDLFHSWGYELVIPPLVEYLESLLLGSGNDLDIETFKLIDQYSGRMMGIRADMTPQVARIDAHRLKRDTPVRLCYLDAVLHARRTGFSNTRSPLQIGAELFGHAGIQSDIEMLRLMVEVLRMTGLKQLHIDLGHVGIFRSLAKEAQFDDQQEAVLFDALQRKSKPEIESYLAKWDTDTKMRRMLVSLIELNGGKEVLEEAKISLKQAGRDVHECIDNVEHVANSAQNQLTSIALHFDLAELRGYRYKSGVVFAAFTAGHGQEVARGGRYDEIGRHFGRVRPATGFSSDLKTLMTLSQPEPYEIRAIAAPWSECVNLQGAVAKLRAEGERVINMLPEQNGDEAAMGCHRVLEKQNGQWVVVERKKR